MPVVGRQEDYDSGHTDSPEEDQEADAYEEAMDNELESRINRNRHKSAYRRQRIVEKMKEFAPESNKDNLVRTKHAIYELNNLHNGSRLSDSAGTLTSSLEVSPLMLTSEVGRKPRSPHW